MNKQIIARIAIFGLGIGVGFLIAKKYYEHVVQEEIESVKEHLGSHIPGLYRKDWGTMDDNRSKSDDGHTGNDPSVAPDDSKFRTAANPMSRSSLDNNPYEQAKKNYSLVKPVVEEEEDCDEDTDAAGMTEADSERMSEIIRTLPYIIDDQSFCEEYNNHDKISLYYYRADDVLCEESEEIIDDVEGTIGYDALAKLDTQTSVWVRNEPLAIDYEVISLNKSYAEVVLGVGVDVNLSPREKYLRQQRRKENGEEYSRREE